MRVYSFSCNKSVNSHLVMNSPNCHQFFFQFILLLFAMSAICSNETDRLSLMSLKAEIVSDPFQSLASWNESSHFCQWLGITCGRKHRRVTVIDFRSKQLSGTLSPFIGNLSFLRYLFIDDNSFVGKIPSEIGRLSRLKDLWMANNSFSGEIPPNISRCLNLEQIDFDRNNLVGSFPVEFQSLTKLRFIYAQGNNLTGELPHYFGNFSDLEVVSVGYNNLEGKIPDSIGTLSALENLEIWENNFWGTVPLSIYNMSNLQNLDAMLNELEGTLPSCLGLTLPNLYRLNIGANQFAGLIPESISNASQLEYLDLSTNKFTGPVPNFSNLQSLDSLAIEENFLGNGEEGDLHFLSSLSNNTILNILAFNSNNLGGIFPRSMGNLSELTHLYTYGNPIYGNIPVDIGELVQLQILSMGDNFNGSIPNSIGYLRELRILGLEGNYFSGNIPHSLGNLTRLTRIDLRNNKLEGNIPPSLAGCLDLSILDLSQNNLSGKIPPEVLSLRSLTFLLDLSENRLSGSLILGQRVSPDLYQFSVADNLLSGDIPSNLDGYQTLSYLSLAGNFFQGVIPPSFSSLRGLEVLNISQNNLSGLVPEYLSTFRFLWSLSLSDNNFEGAVPLTGVFSNASNITVSGNSLLCGGVAELNLPQCVTEEGVPRSSNVSRLRYIIPTCIGATILVFTILVLFLYKKIRASRVPTSSDLVKDSFLQLSYGDLHRATAGFSATNLCGSGKFSCVYKGVLDPDETAVAVKVLKLDVRGATNSFTAECEALRSTRHRNIVKIITLCSSIDFQGNDFKALVYTFMENGDLDNSLHQNSTSLTLLERLNIVIDVASALNYLHHESGQSMVHCDVKPSNVLLDSDLVAHLGDFGLLKFIRENSSSVSSTSPTSSLAIKGTVGYTAPEYGIGSDISTYGDVYSFGILVLEIFSGKRPTDDMFSDGLDLHNFAKMTIPDRVMEIADSLIVQNEQEQTIRDSQSEVSAISDKARECLISVFRIGVACSVESPKERGCVSDVINELHSIKRTFLD